MKKPETKSNHSIEDERPSLRQRLIAGYLANAKADIEISENWQPLEEEAWANIPDYFSENQ